MLLPSAIQNLPAVHGGARRSGSAWSGRPVARNSPSQIALMRFGTLPVFAAANLTGAEEVVGVALGLPASGSHAHYDRRSTSCHSGWRSICAFANGQSGMTETPSRRASSTAWRTNCSPTLRPRNAAGTSV